MEDNAIVNFALLLRPRLKKWSQIIEMGNQLKEFQGNINARIESNLKSYVSSAMKKAYHEL